MSHYDEPLERIADERALRMAAAQATFEAQRDHHLNRAINEATPISIRDLLAGLVAAVERMADAVETLAAARPGVAYSGDHGDAPITFSPQTLSSLYAGKVSLPALPALIEAIKGVSWFGCTHRMDLGSDDLIMTVSSERAIFEKLASLIDMTPAALRATLQEFDRYERGTSYHRVSFPAAWVRAA